MLFYVVFYIIMLPLVYISATNGGTPVAPLREGERISAGFGLWPFQSFPFRTSAGIAATKVGKFDTKKDLDIHEVHDEW